MRILVTGGAGFIGSHVVDHYIEAGHEVLVLDDLSTGHRENVHPKAELVVIDLCDHMRVTTLLEEFRPKLINHHAAQIDIRRSVAEPLFDANVNVVATVNLLQSGVRVDVEGILFASSGGAIYGETTTPAGEDCLKAPISPYGAAKVAVEGYLFAYERTFGLKSLSLRYGNVYGPRQDPTGEAGVVAIFSQAMLSQQRPRIYGAGDQLRDYIYVEDVARSNLLATDFLLAGHPPPGTPDDRAFNIGTGRSASVNDLFAQLKQIIGFSDEPIYSDPRAGELLESRLDVTRAFHELGFEAQESFPDGLARAVEWIRNEQ